ncbi:hypothetical protein [Myxococcus landrumensis]|uniref:YtkA-like domain-containing protein n=1 Tax=Myxococcus landrumensis TaxID=2813577 RepID=A0ABX7NCW7_9BACT|nr:hypothetical protein [Myxococcus landrumus]QSQ16635.1 hypothetical protein JY572_11555 [Myxococcus landrumus]
MERRGDVLELRWADAEERLQGTLHPASPREGEPSMLSLHVGAFEGPEFAGPLTVTFHLKDAPAQQVTRTLQRDGVNWHTEVEFEEPGLYELEVRYQNTRLKVLTGHLTVAAQPLPPGLSWGILALSAGTALALGVRAMVRRVRASAPASPPPETAPVASTPLESASATEPAAATVPPPDAASSQ